MLDSTGVNFQSGVSYKIEMSQLITQEELGRGADLYIEVILLSYQVNLVWLTKV